MTEPLHPEVAILNGALELPPGQRGAYLDGACAGNVALRRQVGALLDAHEQAEDFLKASPAEPEIRRTGMGDSRFVEKPGDVIGRYSLVRQIGEGGCGVVYMAEQEEPVRRRVALKVIKLGMDTKSVIARFEAERQALAMMEHPHIAKVFDAGATEAGRPYFVMELVEGAKITEFCEANNVSMRDRLTLFIQVCQAIQHAHQKGVIHRDIKPSNILVAINDGVPVPKVIDFGIAKATQGRLTDQTLFTAFEQFLGTPAYMSPEQVAVTSQDVDTRSDIYSLGVLLYELLTGRTPFDQKELLAAGLDEMRRTIREREPVKPSTRLTQDLVAADVRRRNRVPADESTSSPGRRQSTVTALRGDLDWIVMKCLEKDRARRYETANGLAADLQRHLNHEPVSARPPSNWYRFRKLIQRNKLAFVATCVLLTALLIVAIGSTVAAWRVAGARRAEQGERQKAETANRDLRQTVSLLELERAEDFFAAHDSASGVAHLAAMLRRDPSNAITAMRLVSALTHRSWARPSGPPLLHTDRVNRVAFSPDSRRVLSASWDAKVRVWDAATGQPLFTVEHGGRVTSAQFNPAGDRFLTASVSGSARVWDAATGEPRTPRLRHEGPVEWTEFSPDGRWVVTASADRAARLWDAATGALKKELRAHSSPVVVARFSPDGERIVTGGFLGSIRLWNAESGEMLLRVEDRSKSLTSLAFSPDGRRLLVACEDGIVRLWNALTGESAGESLVHTRPVWFATFSPDGKWILTACEDGAARLWDARTGQRHGEPLRHESGVIFGVFSPDGRRVLTSSSDVTARVWDVATGLPECQPLRQIERILHAAFSADGRRIVTAANDGIAQVWELREPLEPGTPMRHQEYVLPMAFSPDGRVILSVARDKTVVLWDARSGRVLIEPLRHDRFVHCGDISPDGRRLATGCDDGSIWIWNCGETDPLDGKPAVAPRPIVAGAQHGRRLRTVRYSADGSRLVSASDDGTARVWDAWTGKPITEPLVHGAVVRMAQFSPDGLLVVTASEDRTARVWDAQNGRPVTEPLAHLDHVKWAEFSPDGARVVTASTDNAARLWDARTGRLVAPLLQHTRIVERAVFSPDGRRVATASLDRTAQIWDVTTGRALTLPLRHDSMVDHVVFSADGRRVLTACGSGQARCWDANTGRPLTEWLKVEDHWWVRLNAAAERIAVGSKEGVLRVWEMPRAPVPVPEWFLAFTEAVAGIRFTEQGAIELVPSRRLRELVARGNLNAADADYERLARRFLEAMPKP